MKIINNLAKNTEKDMNREVNIEKKAGLNSNIGKNFKVPKLIMNVKI